MNRLNAHDTELGTYSFIEESPKCLIISLQTYNRSKQFIVCETYFSGAFW